MSKRKRIILASNSRARADLLKALGIGFEIIPSNVDEKAIPLSKPERYVKKLAYMKAEKVSAGIRSGVVIGADTVIFLGNKIFGKPKGRKRAFYMLKELSGKTHRVLTGICIIDASTGKAMTRSVATRVKFRDLSDDEINLYIRTERPFDKAGAYGLQQNGAMFVESIEGDYSNVVGLPIDTLCRMLKDIGAV